MTRYPVNAINIATLNIVPSPNLDGSGLVILFKMTAATHAIRKFRTLPAISDVRVLFGIRHPFLRELTQSPWFDFY